MFNDKPTDRLIIHKVKNALKSDLPTNTLLKHNFKFGIIPNSSYFSDNSNKTTAVETLEKIPIPKRGAI